MLLQSPPSQVSSSPKMVQIRLPPSEAEDVAPASLKGVRDLDSEDPEHPHPRLETLPSSSEHLLKRAPCLRIPHPQVIHAPFPGQLPGKLRLMRAGAWACPSILPLL